MSSSSPKGNAGAALLMRIAELRAWLFLIVLIVFFEVWARIAYGSSFILNVYNLQSISVFATAPIRPASTPPTALATASSPRRR